MTATPLAMAAPSRPGWMPGLHGTKPRGTTLRCLGLCQCFQRGRGLTVRLQRSVESLKAIGPDGDH